MPKGIVMEIKDKSIVVMTTDGQFRRVPKRGISCSVGEELELPASREGSVSRMMRYRYISAAAVVCLIVFSALGLFSGKGEEDEVVAYVTLDINPSVEAGLNAAEEVVEVRGINDDGTNLIQGFDYKGLTIEAFSEALIDRLELSHYLDGGELNILIASTVISTHVELDESALKQKVESKVVEYISKKHDRAKQQIVVTALSAPKEVRTEAVEQGVSTGRMAALLLSQGDEKPIELEEIKTKPVKQLFKEHSEVQQRIASQNADTKEQWKDQLKEQLKLLKEKQKEREKEENEGKEEEEQEKGEKEERTGRDKHDNEKSGKPDNVRNGGRDQDRDEDDDRNDDDRNREDRKQEDRERKIGSRRSGRNKRSGNRSMTGMTMMMTIVTMMTIVMTPGTSLATIGTMRKKTTETTMPEQTAKIRAMRGLPETTLAIVLLPGTIMRTSLRARRMNERIKTIAATIR